MHRKPFLLFAITASLLAGGASNASADPTNYEAVLAPPATDLSSSACNHTDMSTWTAPGEPIINGKYLPPDNANISFGLNSNCAFFNWGQRMFMWITSEVDEQLVLNSDAFYTLVPTGPSNKLNPVPGNLAEAGTVSVRNGKPKSPYTLDQAGDRDALISTRGSLVYYSKHVNNFFLEFLKVWPKSGLDHFPAFDSERQLILSLLAGAATSNGVPELDPSHQMIVELKASWVELDKILQESSFSADDFITVEATIPNLVPTPGNLLWVQDGTRETQLALVGMHVVGSAGGKTGGFSNSLTAHPEMIWATFEHIYNAPMAMPYSYQSAVPPTNGSKFAQFNAQEAADALPWIFYDSKRTDHLNKARAKLRVDGVITGINGPIGPSSIERINAWGLANDPSAHSAKTIGTPAQDAIVRTEAISAWRDAIAQLSNENEKDVRGNYVQTGAIWSAGANESKNPNVSYYIPTGADDHTSGSMMLSNATMETFTQDTNCFSCHNAGGTDKSGPPAIFNLSHIFNRILLPD